MSCVDILSLKTKPASAIFPGSTECRSFIFLVSISPWQAKIRYLTPEVISFRFFQSILGTEARGDKLSFCISFIPIIYSSSSSVWHTIFSSLYWHWVSRRNYSQHLHPFLCRSGENRSLSCTFPRDVSDKPRVTWFAGIVHSLNKPNQQNGRNFCIMLDLYVSANLFHNGNKCF